MNSKKIFGLLGEKLAHSFSPAIHSYLGDYAYTLFEVNPAELGKFMDAREFDGINVTIPYKLAVIPYCASLSDEARATGSVNTIIKDARGALHGHNTDCHGFCEMLERGGIDPRGKKALVLGSGGSARSVRSALAGLGAREIVTVSRGGENNYNNIELHYDADIIVNTTPVGMYPDNGRSPLSLAGFAKLGGVADLIYNPMRTKLLFEAERLNINSVNGLPMLTAQAEKACGLFLNGPPRPWLADEICGLMRKQMRNIVLIGMPGCGKSTAGRMLAKALGRPFADIDDIISVAANKSIPKIFNEDGEEWFRKLETEALTSETKKSGHVIAAGGGAVTKPENYELLRQNSLVVYLKRGLDKLATDGRPVSQSAGIAAIAEKRLPLYEAWCDCAVQADDNPELTINRIMEAIS